jgi:peptidoglycan/xylan/chitin deacetylase (PgdA/CDA1 family)
MRTVILCYHKVGPVAEEGRFLNVEPRHLAAQVRFFARRSGPLVSLKQFLTGTPSAAVLTFDDTYESTANHAPAILAETQSHATFFVVTQKTASDWDGDRASPLAPREQIEALARAGHEIGNHTRTHLHLNATADFAEEISGAGSDLTDWGHPLVTFCYPYGSLNPAVVAEVRRQGYLGAVSLQKGRVQEDSDRWQLPRIVVGYSDGLPGLLYKLYIRPLLPK